LLQDGQFQRVGGNETLKVDVRVLAATNQNLEAMIGDNRFRRDLYYRIRDVTLHLPPLREREDDIAELAHYFLFRLNRHLGTAVQSISSEALELLARHPWPGNVRELQSVLREALIVCTGPTLLPEFLALSAPPPSAEAEKIESVDSDGDANWHSLAEMLDEGVKSKRPELYRQLIHRFDSLVLTNVMQAVGGLQSKAAEVLGLSRPTLRAKLRLIARKGAEPPPQ
jgi:DNA-binding NtrC family response regulator